MGGGCSSSSVRVNVTDNTQAKMDLASSKLDDFSKEEQLGKGHFGEVHRVRHQATGLICAMKTVKRRGFSSKTTEQEKKRRAEKDKMESKILESMSHPFIVHLYKTFRSDNHLFIVMEYLNGGELYKHLKKYGRFTFQMVKFYSAEILLAIEYLHKKSIVYRDLKPENVVINENHAIMTDFGLAKHLEFGSGGRTHTFCGTPEYISPEIINNEGHDHSTDWWSFGVLIYEMLCGFSPFKADKEDVTYKLIRAAQSPSHGVSYSTHVDAGSKDLISKLLVVDISQRLGSGEGGGAEVKKHKFFRGVDWPAMISKQLAGPKLTSAGSVETAEKKH